MKRDKTLEYIINMLTDSKKDISKLWVKLSEDEKIDVQREVIHLYGYIGMMCKSK